MANQAERVISRFGGVTKLAAAYDGASANAIYKWTYPKDRGGTGGVIPGDHVPALISLAQKLDVELELADFGAGEATS